MVQDYSNDWKGGKGSHWEPNCHKNPSLVIEVGKLKIFACRGSQSYRGEPYDLKIPCLEDPTSFGNEPYVVSSLSEEQRAVFDRFVYDVPASDYIGIIWRDGGVPYLTQAWWERLAENLLAAAQATEADDYKVQVYCFGGHGRTGTCLAILACFLGACEEGDPVQWVRERYCRETVETAAQIEYVKKITGRDVTVKGAYALASEKYKAPVGLLPAPVGERVTEIKGKGPQPKTGGQYVSLPRGDGVPTSEKESGGRYLYSSSPYANATMGRDAPPGYQYRRFQNGTVGLRSLTKGERKRLTKLGGRVAFIHLDSKTGQPRDTVADLKRNTGIAGYPWEPNMRGDKRDILAAEADALLAGEATNPEANAPTAPNLEHVEGGLVPPDVKARMEEVAQEIIDNGVDAGWDEATIQKGLEAARRRGWLDYLFPDQKDE